MTAGSSVATRSGAAGPDLELWAETADGTATLINHSENRTYRVERADGERFILRLHRPGYQSAAEIESELEWLAALRRDTDLPVPRPLIGRDGKLVQMMRGLDGTAQHGVLFAFEPGVEPAAGGELGDLFETLGRFAAIAHRHAAAFTPSAGFSRAEWTARSILDADGRWGDWRQAPHVEGEIAETLAALDHRLRIVLAAYGQSPDRFGLIHADMRLANLLVDGEHVTLIDFDDCGYGWFLYDLAAALSFLDDSPKAPALRERWIEGYTPIRELSPADLGSIDALILLRRMALLAWIGSHGETDLAKAHAADFARMTAELASRYLSGEPLTPSR